MSIVYWTPISNNKGLGDFPVAQILFQEPVSVFNYIMENRQYSLYLKCPAFIDYCKNTFVIKAPFDFDARFNNGVFETTLGINLTRYVFTRDNDRGSNDPQLITLPPTYVFYSKEDVMIESMPCFLAASKSTENLSLIPGTFNIGKWTRSIDFTCEVIDASKEINIKKDDPLFFIRFIPKSGEKIVFERVEEDLQLTQKMDACSNLKLFESGLPLKKLYKMAESYLGLLKK